MKKDDQPIVVEQAFKSSIDNVWKAVTEAPKMRQWFFDNIPSFKPEVGFKTQFNVTSGDRNFLHKWEITEVVPQKLITYNWKYEGYPGNSFVTFELSENNNSTNLTLTHDIVEDFPDDIPEFSRESCIGGWEYFIKQSLNKYLE